MSTTDLLEAISFYKENERNSSRSYADAARIVTNPMAKMLFEQLSEFENFHYEQITALEESLVKQGGFIAYEGKTLELPPVFEVKAANEPNQKSLMTIISETMQLEKEAQEKYADLAAEIADSQGHAMFIRLSEEEFQHYRILSDAYWALNNLGSWKWALQ